MLGGGKDIRPRSGRMGHGIHGTGMAMVGKIRRNSPFIAPRLKRQDRLFGKGLSDPPHGGTIMSEQIAKLNIEEKLIACIELVQKRQADIQALRAENARLRGAVESFHNSIPAYSKKKLHGLQGEYWSPAGMMIDTELIANLYAALQPERGKP